MISPGFLHQLARFALSGAATCDPNKSVCQTGLPVVNAGSSQVAHGLAIVFEAIAAVAVLMIVIAGLRFVRGSGNPQEMDKARNTIIYSVVGLLVSLTAVSIVSLVLGHL